VPRSVRPGRRRGFALLVVIWGVGVITLLIVSFMTTARARLQAAFNAAGVTETQLLAEGAVNLAIVKLLAEQSAAPLANAQPPHDGAPTYCSLSGATVSIAIEDEEGKVDLNTASDKLLETMLIGFGADPREAGALARAITEFREQPASAVDARFAAPGYSDRPFGPKRMPFQTTLELDQVSGFEPALTRMLLPFVTVHSRSPGVDPTIAPPALFAALSGYRPEVVRMIAARSDPKSVDRRDSRFPREYAQAGSHSGAYLIHAEVARPNGAIGVEEALVRVGGVSGGGVSGGEPFTILELRRGRARDKERLRAMAGRSPPPC
jgi:general secretion pathway protein K